MDRRSTMNRVDCPRHRAELGRRFKNSRFASIGRHNRRLIADRARSVVISSAFGVALRDFGKSLKAMGFEPMTYGLKVRCSTS